MDNIENIRKFKSTYKIKTRKIEQYEKHYLINQLEDCKCKTDSGCIIYIFRISIYDEIQRKLIIQSFSFFFCIFFL